MAARHKGDTKSGDRQSNKRELRPYGSLYAHSPFRRDASCYYLCGQCALRYLNVTWFSTENVGACMGLGPRRRLPSPGYVTGVRFEVNETKVVLIPQRYLLSYD